MKQTAMEDLKEDLQKTIVTANEALFVIDNYEIRIACQEVVRITLKNIIKRIDEELLEMEKKQMIDFSEYLNVNYYKFNKEQLKELASVSPKVEKYIKEWHPTALNENEKELTLEEKINEIYIKLKNK